MNNYLLLIPLVVILILISPIKITTKISFNLFQNKGTIGLFFYKFKILSRVFQLTDEGVKIYKQISKSEDHSEIEDLFLENLFLQVYKKTQLRLLQVNYNIGLIDAFKTAMACGYINVFFMILFTRLKTYKPTASFLLCDNMAYNQHVFELSILSKASISLFEIVYSLINSVILSIKRENA